MTAAFVQKASKAYTTTTTLSAAADPSATSVLMLAISWDNTTIKNMPTVTDNFGNVWRFLDSNYSPVNKQAMAVFWTPGGGTGTGYVVTTAWGSVNTHAVIWHEASGLNQSGDMIDCRLQTFQRNTTGITFPLTSSIDGEYFFAAICNTSNTNTFTAGSGWTQRDQLSGGGLLQTQDLVQGTKGARTVNWTNTSADAVAIAMSFAPSGSSLPAPSSPASSMPGIGQRLESVWGRRLANASPLGADLFAPFGSSQRKTVWENWYLASGGISGAAAITEAADTLSAAGAIAIDGDASITEGSDTSASTATLALAAAAAITEAGDTSTATGALAIVGALSATEADDTLSAAGAAGAGAISGVLAATEADDTLSATGALAIAASLSATEVGDTISSSAALAIAAAAAISEAADTLSATATSTISGALSVAEADDVLTATGEGPGGSTPTDGFWQIRQIRRA